MIRFVRASVLCSFGSGGSSMVSPGRSTPARTANLRAIGTRPPNAEGLRLVGLCVPRGLPDLVRHPLAELAVRQPRLAFLHKRDASSAVRLAVAIENGEVHQRVVEDVSDDRGERLSAVDMGKAPVTGKAGRREPDDAADSRENPSHGGFSSLGSGRRPNTSEEMICQKRIQASGVAPLCRAQRHTHVSDIQPSGPRQGRFFLRRVSNHLGNKWQWPELPFVRKRIRTQ